MELVDGDVRRERLRGLDDHRAQELGLTLRVQLAALGVRRHAELDERAARLGRERALAPDAGRERQQCRLLGSEGDVLGQLRTVVDGLVGGPGATLLTGLAAGTRERATTGAGAVAAALVTGPMRVTSTPLELDLGVILCTVAGLMNLVVMCDAFTVAERSVFFVPLDGEAGGGSAVPTTGSEEASA